MPINLSRHMLEQVREMIFVSILLLIVTIATNSMSTVIGDAWIGRLSQAAYEALTIVRTKGYG
eukprot:4503423-Amphidinium_carterae.1